jgi:hypothetical protein
VAKQKKVDGIPCLLCTHARDEGKFQEACSEKRIEFWNASMGYSEGDVAGSNGVLKGIPIALCTKYKEDKCQTRPVTASNPDVFFPSL